mmetsp:Transcript_7683/g.22673  ORF Transcript_7683/g.22673 Transcript_7683/m.22673 type:complete len:228 (-) Transcript_7683:504-1187(-)
MASCMSASDSSALLRSASSMVGMPSPGPAPGALLMPPAPLALGPTRPLDMSRASMASRGSTPRLRMRPRRSSQNTPAGPRSAAVERVRQPSMLSTGRQERGAPQQSISRPARSTPPPEPSARASCVSIEDADLPAWPSAGGGSARPAPSEPRKSPALPTVELPRLRRRREAVSRPREAPMYRIKSANTRQSCTATAPAVRAPRLNAPAATRCHARQRSSTSEVHTRS